MDLELIKSMTLSVITSTVFVSAIVIPVAKGIIDRHFAKKLAEHENELRILTEVRKSELAKELQEHSLFSNKKHEIYPEYYKMLMEVHSRVLNRIVTRPDYHSIPWSEVERYLIERQISNVEIEKINRIKKRVDGENKAYKEIDHLLEKHSHRKTEAEFIKVHNYLLSTQLYFADDTFNKALQIDNSLNTILINKEMRIFEGILSCEERSEVSENEEIVNTGMQELKILMKRDLQAGYVKQ